MAVAAPALALPASPLTGGDDVVIERRIDSRELRQRWRQEAGVDAAASLAAHDEVLLCRCRATGLRFFHPPDVAGDAGFYRQLQHHPWYYAPERWEYGPALGWLPAGAPVLEVGCGNGEFLRRAAAAGHRIRGIELNPDAVAAATARGLSCEERDLTELAGAAPGAFAAVCSFQVLEHVADPHGFLSACVRLLQPGGRLILSVPDAEGWIRLHDFLFDLPPHHMLGWSARAFRSLGPLFGLDVEHLAYEPLPVSQIENYLTAQRARWRHPGLRRLLFNRFTLPVWTAVLRTPFLPVRGPTMLVVLRLAPHA